MWMPLKQFQRPVRVIGADECRKAAFVGDVKRIEAEYLAGSPDLCGDRDAFFVDGDAKSG